MGIDQPLEAWDQLRRCRLTDTSVHRRVVLVVRAITDAYEHARSIGIEWQESLGPRKQENLFGARLTDSVNLSKGAHRVASRETKSPVERTVERVNHERGGVLHVTDAVVDADRAANAGDLAQCRRLRVENGLGR